MSASPHGRICMTSGRKTANRLTRAVPVRMVMSLGGLPARAGAGLVARPGWTGPDLPLR